MTDPISDEFTRECEHRKSAQEGDMIYFCLTHGEIMCEQCAKDHALSFHLYELEDVMNPLRLYGKKKDEY